MLLILLLSVMVVYLRNLYSDVAELRSQCNLTHHNYLTAKHTLDIAYLQEKYPEMELRITAAENTAVSAENTANEMREEFDHFKRLNRSDFLMPSVLEREALDGEV
jgi:hypothetical protein